MFTGDFLLNDAFWCIVCYEKSFFNGIRIQSQILCKKIVLYAKITLSLTPKN